MLLPLVGDEDDNYDDHDDDDDDAVKQAAAAAEASHARGGRHMPRTRPSHGGRAQVGGHANPLPRSLFDDTANLLCVSELHVNRQRII